MTIQEYLNKTSNFLGLAEDEFEVEVEKKSDRVEVEIDVPKEKASQFIGVRGRNLFALQYLLRLVFREKYEDENIVLDVNGYRAQKENELVEQAVEDARAVQETGREKVYRHLNSYERYLVHSGIAAEESLEDVTTYSADVDDQRWLTICLKEDGPKSDQEEYESE